MRKHQKTVKKTLTIATIAAMGMTFAMTAPNLASADQINHSVVPYDVPSGDMGFKNRNEKSIIGDLLGGTDVQASLNRVGFAYYNSYIAGTKIGSSPTLTFKDSPDSVETKFNLNITGTSNNLKFDSSVVEYVGENEFVNDSDQTQKFSTAKYTKTVTESIATSITKGFKVGGDASNLFTIPLILNNGVKVNAEFNSSTTETNTKTETKSIEASVQTVEVPPHKKYKVDVVLEQRNFWGDVTFTGEGLNPMTTIKGTARYWGPNGMGIWEQHTWSKNTGFFMNALPNFSLNGVEIIYNSNTGESRVKVEGAGRVEGIFGSKLVVNIYDITVETEPPVLVETRSLE